MTFEVKNGCFTYPRNKRPTLENINFSIDGGTIMTILGRNGIGKTTLVKCMTGVLNWKSGCIVADGKEMSSVCQLKTIAFVPQSHPLSYPYTVRDMVIMGRVREMGMLSIPTRKDREKADAAIEELGLTELANRRCTELSGGQLQMVFIARALASEPKILVMDEPESHLDFKNQFNILDLIVRLSSERGLSCIINTHYPDHALRISDKTLLLGDGTSDFGDTTDILTDENIKKYFDVRAKITNVVAEGKTYKSFLVIEANA